MRPSRIVVGEVREAEALDLLIALNSGLPGMGTLHANSSRDAITKLQTLPLLAGENISHKFIAPTVAAALDLVVHLSLGSDGVRRVNEVAAVTGRFENDRAEIEMLWRWNGFEYERGVGVIGNDEKFRAAGIPIQSWWNE
jgi:pilus assembly protein CpaF